MRENTNLLSRRGKKAETCQDTFQVQEESREKIFSVKDRRRETNLPNALALFKIEDSKIFKSEDWTL